MTYYHVKRENLKICGVEFIRIKLFTASEDGYQLERDIKVTDHILADRIEKLWKSDPELVFALINSSL